MSARPREVTALHTRLLKCALEPEAARAWWAARGEKHPRLAFEGFWFGDRSLPRVEVLFANLRARFDAFPEALSVLSRWADMAPDTRALICHWHLQLSDPLYRAFTGPYLEGRRAQGLLELDRERALGFVNTQGGDRWTLTTKLQFASKLLSSAYGAGLLQQSRDPRTQRRPRVPDEALSYLLYLLRGTDFNGSLLDNPYLRSVWLDGPALEDRLRVLPGLKLSRQGEVVELTWRYPTLTAFAEATLPLEAAP